MAMGGRPETFAGLAGMGDLVATCISPLSRNRTVGEMLGKGRSIDEIIAEMHMVAEGVETTRVVMELAAEHGVDMPICSEMDAVINHGRPPQVAYRGLLRRSPKPEVRE
jgi:glycerol-3-phosphate dehydrogenase (NAD(P)+)